MKKRVFALFLSIVMCLSLLPAGAFAQEEIVPVDENTEEFQIPAEEFTAELPNTDEEIVMIEPDGAFADIEIPDAPAEEDDVEILSEVVDETEPESTGLTLTPDGEMMASVDLSDIILSAGGLLPENDGKASTLTASPGQTVYDVLYEGVKAHAEAIDVREFNIPKSQAGLVYSNVINSNPNLYFASSSCRYYYSESTNCVTSYVPTYLTEYYNTEASYEAGVAKALSCVKSGMSDEQKALALHDYLTTHIVYDSTENARYNAYGALVLGRCVCQGYALAYLELLTRCGIGCEVVTSDDINHAWNQVKINGSWYQVDATWDDSLTGGKDVPGRALHKYFLLSDSAVTDHSNDWVRNNTCNSSYYDDGSYWGGINSQIIMPDADNAYYITGESGKNVKLTRRSSGGTENVFTFNTRWTASSGGYWTGIYSYPSYDGGLLWLNTADNIIVCSLGSGTYETVYTAPAGSQIYALFRENGQTTIALGNTPNSLTVSQAAISAPTSGNNITWTLENGVLTISGTGAMDDYTDQSDKPWDSVKDSITSVVIEDGVTSIGRWVFYECTSLESIEIPSSVTSIGGYAFVGCTSLESIEIPSSVTRIGNGAFGGCTSLESIEIPSGVTSIYDFTFGSCTSLKSIWIPSNVTSIDCYAFNRCTCLTTVNYGGTAEQWNAIEIDTADGGNNALLSATVNFYNGAPTSGQCGENVSWSVSNGVLTISGTGEMYDNMGAEMPWNSTIGSYITKAVVENGVTGICPRVFNGCRNLKEIVIGDDVAYIGDSVATNCPILETITVGAGNTAFTLSDGILYNKNMTLLVLCPAAKTGEVNIPDSVTGFASGAFTNCGSLTAVNIGSGVTGSVDGVFGGCACSVAINVASSNPALRSDNGSLFSKDGSVLYAYHPTGNTAYTVPESVSVIGTAAFLRCTGLKSIVLPDTVTSIGAAAFNTCSGLESMSVPESVTQIMPTVFLGCTSLTEVSLPASLTSIGNVAFVNCTSLTTVNYGGTAEQWANVTKGEGNDALINADIRFSDGSISNEAELRDALESGTDEIVITGSITVSSNLTVPDGKFVSVVEGGKLEMTDGAVLAVEGVLSIFDGGLVDATSGGFVVCQNATVQIGEGSRLDINGSTYENRADGSRIYVLLEDEVFEGVTGVGFSEYQLCCRAWTADDFAAAQTLAVNNPDNTFIISLFADMSLSGNVADNVLIRIAAGEDDAPVTLTVDANTTLAAKNILFGYSYAALVVKGTLDMTDSGMWLDQYGSRLTVDEGGVIELGNGGLYIGADAAVVNNGTINVNDAGNIRIDGTWTGKGVTAYNEAGDETALRQALLGDVYSVYLDGDLTLTDDLTVPEGKQLNIRKSAKLTVPEGVTLTVLGRIELRGELGATDAAGFIVGDNSDIWVDSGKLSVNKDIYGGSEWTHIFVNVTGYPETAVPEINGLGTDKYSYQYDIYSENDFNNALACAAAYPLTTLKLAMRSNRSVDGTLPDNVKLCVGCNWNEGGTDVEVCVEAGKTLNVGSGIEFWDNGAVLVVKGTLNTTDINIFVGDNNKNCNMLVIENGGTVNADRIDLGSDTQILDMGALTVGEIITVGGDLCLQGGADLDLSDVRFELTESGNVWVERDSELTVNSDNYRIYEGNYITADITGNLTLRPVTGVNYGEVMYNVDVAGLSGINATVGAAQADPENGFLLTVCGNTELYGNLPSNLTVRIVPDYRNENAPVTVTVPADKTLNLGNKLLINGGTTLTVNGEVNVGNGGVEVRSGSTLNVNGSMSLEGSYMYVAPGAVVNNDGTVSTDDLNNIYVEGEWNGFMPTSPNLAANEAELAEKLADEDLDEVIIYNGFEISGEVTIPENKRVIVNCETLTVTGTLNVLGQIQINNGSTVDAENAAAFVLGENSNININPNAMLKLGAGYSNTTDWSHISVNVSDGFNQAVTGIEDKSQYNYYYDVFQESKLDDAMGIASSHPDDSFTIAIRCDMELYGTLPGNTYLAVGCDWENNAAPVTVTIPADKTLNIKKLDFYDIGTVVEVYGTLDVSDGHIQVNGVGENDAPNVLNVRSGGTLELGNGSMYIGWGSEVNCYGGYVHIVSNDNIRNDGTFNVRINADNIVVTEDGLVAALQDDRFDRVNIFDSIRIEGNVVIPEGKTVTTSKPNSSLSFGVNGSLTVNGGLELGSTTTLDAENQGMVRVGQNSYILVNGAYVKLSGNTFEKSDYGCKIFIETNSGFDAARGRVTGTTSDQYCYILNVWAELAFTDAVDTAAANPDELFRIEPRGTMSIYGDVPDNAWVEIGRDFNADDQCSVITVPEGKTLNMGGDLRFCDDNNSLVIDGHLSFRTGRLDINCWGSTVTVNGSIWLSGDGMFVNENTELNGTGSISAGSRDSVEFRNGGTYSNIEYRNEPCDEESFLRALETGGNEIYVYTDITVNEDFNIPQWQTLYVRGGNTTLTLKGNVTVDGIIEVMQGATVDVYDAESFTVNDDGTLRIGDAAHFRAKEETANIVGNYSVSISMTGTDAQALTQAVGCYSGIPEEKVIYCGDVFETDDFNSMIALAQQYPGKRFGSCVHTELELEGEIPGNEVLGLRRKYPENTPAKITVPDGKELIVNDWIFMEEDDCGIEVEGKLTLTGGYIAMFCEGNYLNVAEGGCVELGSGGILLNGGTSVNNLGTVHLTDLQNNGGEWTGNDPIFDHTVTYDARGGEGAPEPQLKPYGEPITLSDAVPVLEGYKFLGWAKKLSVTYPDYLPGALFTEEQNVTLRAVWERIPGEDEPAFVVSERGGVAGQTAVVTVSVVNNPGIAALSLGLVYDTELFTLTDATGEGLSGTWDSNEKIVWQSDCGNQDNDGVILTLEFKVADDAPLGSYPIGLSFESGDICNDDREPVEFANVTGSITVNNHIPGDVTGDGNVGTKDFVTLMKYVAGYRDMVYDPYALDVTNDGKINTIDFITLMHFVAGREGVVVY